MTQSEIQNIVENCRFEVAGEPYLFCVLWNKRGQMYLQGAYFEDDTVTKEPKRQQTRKWILSENMTKSEIVQTVFKLAITSMEHRTREHFLYKGQRVFSPHYDIDALVELCRNNQFDERDWYAPEEAQSATP